MRKILIFISAFLAFQSVVSLTFALYLNSVNSFDPNKTVQIEGTNVRLEYVTPTSAEAYLYILGSNGLEGVIDIKEITASEPIISDTGYQNYITPYIHLVSDSLDTYNIELNGGHKDLLILEINEAPITGKQIFFELAGDDKYKEFDVYLNGIFYSKIPRGTVSFSLDVNRNLPYIVTITKKDYCAWNRIIISGFAPSVLPGVFCQKEHAKVFLITDQVNTKVYVDGELSEISKDSLVLLKVSGGNHTIRLEKDGFESLSQSFEINPGNVIFINSQLSPISPLPDSDGDGVPDHQDSCLNTPFGKSVDFKGCSQSQLDFDGDGVTDDLDKCPTQAEVFNDYQDLDGCPDIKPLQDSDEDGIIDENDNCPNEPETLNNYQDTDGCPDVVPTTTSPPTTLPPTPQATPAPKPDEKTEITSPDDIQTSVKGRIASIEKLLIDLTELVFTGKKIGADVSAVEDKINSARLVLAEANASYTIAMQKLREGDLISALNQGNNAYIKGTSGMTMLDEAKPPLYSAIKKKLSDNVGSTESIANLGKTLMIGGDAEQKLILAKNELLAVDGAFKTGDLALAKEHILNADKLLSEARMKVYSTFGAILFLGIVAMGVFLKLRSVPPRPKAREAKGYEVKTTVPKQEPPEATAKAISVAGLSKSYKKSVILENVAFEINQGTLCGIVGSSGGGKSTLIEGIAGRTPSDKGEIKILGIDTKKDRMKINQFVGFVPQHPELYLDQTVWQNVMNSALKWNVKDAEAKSEKILKQLDIYGRKDVIAKNLSGGQLKRLSLGMELIREPPILVLDEPTTGLDPTSRDQILTALSKVVSSEKRTAVFTTHFMDEAEHCDEVIIVGNAQILAKGPPSELARKMPGGGRIVNITLEEVSENLVSRVSGLEGVKKVIREGRVLKMIMEHPDPVTVSQNVKEFGGVVEEAKIAKAGMKEVFVYYTGVYPEDVK